MQNTSNPRMDGILGCSHGPIFGEKVFYLRRGKRHWVPSGAWIKQNGFVFPDEVRAVSDELLLTFLPGQPAPMTFSEDELRQECLQTVSDARDAAASQLQGIGLEIGAGASPFPVPLRCQVQYGDMYSYDELLAHAYVGQGVHDIVAPTIKTDLDTLQGIYDDSLDFIVACHVIEHTRNPMGAIANAYGKLRSGGHLVLVIPDKERTFDRPRDVTPLDHLIEDFMHPDPARDEQHYRDFFEKAEGFDLWLTSNGTTWQEQCKKDYSIHFHTWTYNSFGEMLKWIQLNSVPFDLIWKSRAISNGIEFYYVLEK